MFVFKSENREVVVPGFLARYNGKVMLSDYRRYRSLLPFYVGCGALIFGWTIYSLFSDANGPVLLSFSAFMFLYAFRSFARSMVEVDLRKKEAIVESASIMTHIDVLLAGGTLCLIGVKYQYLTGEFSGAQFKIIGWGMITVAIGYFFALWGRGGRS